MYSLHQEVAERGETPKNIGQIHDIGRCDPVASPVAFPNSPQGGQER